VLIEAATSAAAAADGQARYHSHHMPASVVQRSSGAGQSYMLCFTAGRHRKSSRLHPT